MGIEMSRPFFSASLRVLVAVVCLAGLAGCAVPKVDIAEPTTARPADPVVLHARHRPTGGIFSNAPGYRPLFSHVRALNVLATPTSRPRETHNSPPTHHPP